jgi:hypothetical protein
MLDPNTVAITSVIANLALALSLVVALIFGIAQVRAAERDRKERLTLDTLRNFQSHEFAEHIYYIVSQDMPKNREELNARSAKEQIVFIQFAQEMESLGILVSENLIDIDLVEKTLGSFVTTSWEKYKPVILGMRKNDPYLSEYFQWLAEQIEKRMRENPRKPFYETNYKLKK